MCKTALSQPPVTAEVGALGSARLCSPAMSQQRVTPSACPIIWIAAFFSFKKTSLHVFHLLQVLYVNHF